jgi:DNA-binding CsgD family transcriptional regulator/PAS domain-containing protein
MVHDDPQELSDVIGAIYDCALDPERWREALPRILEFSRSSCGALAIHDYAHARTGRLFDHGYAEDYLKVYLEKYQQMNPLPIAMQALPVGEVATQAMLIDEEELFETRFYREFLSPYRMHDALSVNILRSEHRMAMLFGNRRDIEPRYGERDVQAWRLLVPHVCRALEISNALDLRTLSSAALELALDALTVGVFLLDHKGRVVHMNQAGEHQVKAGSALRVSNHRLAASSKEAQSELFAVITATAQSDLAKAGGRAIVLPSVDGAGYVANVLPLDAGERRKLLAPFAAVTAVFVQDPAVVPMMPGEAFAKMHGLTGAELRVLLTLAPGLNLKEAAEILGIGEGTARSHLHRIFAKTGTSRQAELLRLLMATTPPLRADPVAPA